MTEHIEHCGAEPKFKVGDRVRVFRVLDEFTSPDLVGWTGTVTEVETLPPLGYCVCGTDMGGSPQHNYDVDGRYMNEQMLELYQSEGERYASIHKLT